MKKVYSLFLLYFIIHSVSAQRSFILSRQDKRGFVSLTAGVSFPTGEFGSQAVANSMAGLAGRGTLTQASVGFRLTLRSGLMAQFSSSQHPMKANPLQTEALQQRFPVNDWQTATGLWSSRMLLLGPYTTLPLNRFSVSTRLLGGYSMVSCPEAIVNTTNLRVTMDSQLSQSLAYGLGITCRYRLGKVLALEANADYATTQFTYKDLVTTTNIGGAVQRTGVSGRKPISMVNVSGGLVFLFSNRRIL